MRHDELALWVLPAIGQGRQERIAERGKWDARDDDAGRRLLDLLGAFPEAARPQQDNARLGAEGVPELTGRAILPLRQHEDVVALQRAADAVRTRAQRG